MVAVDGVRAVLVTPRAEIRPQPQALALMSPPETISFSFKSIINCFLFEYSFANP